VMPIDLHLSPIVSVVCRRTLFIGLMILAFASTTAAQETVRITLPSSLAFNVTNISNTVTATPNPTTLRFQQAVLLPNRALRVSVRADTSTFTPPNGTTRIPAAYVSWTTSSPTRATGANGTLSSTAYTMVLQSQTNANNGNIDVTWKLAPLPAGVHAGNHTLTIRWKLESVVP
jgi:hypothetical protein